MDCLHLVHYKYSRSMEEYEDGEKRSPQTRFEPSTPGSGIFCTNVEPR